MHQFLQLVGCKISVREDVIRTFRWYFAAPTGSPGALIATSITFTSITLSWTEINCLDRNGIITRYMIKYGEGHTTMDRIIGTKTNDTFYLITGLKPYTTYNFIIAGVNSVKTGPFSSPGIVFKTMASS